MTTIFSAVLSRALASRNYRLYFIGQLVSLAGTWMQQIAMSWLAYRLSNSALVLGMVAFAGQIPILLFGSFMGVVTDRFNRRRILLATQSLAMVQATLLALLTWQGWISPAWLIGMALLMGCINALDVPARQSFVVELVERKADLPNAIALNSFLMNAARFVGPALAGFAVAAVGEAVCFVINALSYLAVLAALRAIDSRPRPPHAGPALHALREGFRYALGHRDIRTFLLLVAIVSFLVTPYAVMMPLFAREILGGDARTFGLLIGSAGAGSLMASLYLASRAETAQLPARIAAAVMAAGCALALFAVNRHMLLAFPVVMVLGFAVIVAVAGSNTLIQTLVEDVYRGRVMALFSMAFLGVAPLGSLAVGSLAQRVGVPHTLLACGLASALAGFAVRRRLTGVRRQPPAAAQD
ncbi:MAG: MFS transporter [Rhodocyclaceae bacterium]|nr:MFS transporter [Rhodocyclaceae bacterium]